MNIKFAKPKPTIRLRKGIVPVGTITSTQLVKHVGKKVKSIELENNNVDGE